VSVDLRQSAASVPLAEVTSAIPRPEPGGRAYVVPYAEVERRTDDGPWTPYARAWPPDGLAGAAVAVAARDATTAEIPASQGLPLPGGMTGGINAGWPDAQCVPEVRSIDGGLPEGVSRRHPAFAGAPAGTKVAFTAAGRAPARGRHPRPRGRLVPGRPRHDRHPALGRRSLAYLAVCEQLRTDLQAENVRHRQSEFDSPPRRNGTVATLLPAF
jgi:hypothetical protein